jgi:hypothetical protein
VGGERDTQSTNLASALASAFDVAPFQPYILSPGRRQRRTVMAVAPVRLFFLRELARANALLGGLSSAGEAARLSAAVTVKVASWQPSTTMS